MDQVTQLRIVVSQALNETRSPETAAYFAEKLLALSNDLDDVLLCAQAYRANGEPRRAYNVLCGIENSLCVMLSTPRALHAACLVLMDYGMIYETLKHLEWYHKARQLGAAVDLRGDPSALRVQLDKTPNVIRTEPLRSFDRRDVVTAHHNTHTHTHTKPARFHKTPITANYYAIIDRVPAVVHTGQNVPADRKLGVRKAVLRKRTGAGPSLLRRIQHAVLRQHDGGGRAHKASLQLGGPRAF